MEQIFHLQTFPKCVRHLILLDLRANKSANYSDCKQKKLQGKNLSNCFIENM